MSTFYSGAPVAQSGVMKLWAGVHVPGDGYRRFEIEKEVFWLRKGELKLEFLHGGKCVKEGSTFNDFYGFMTCAGCVEDARAWAREYSVDASSTAEVIATLTVFDSPAVIDTKPDSIAHNRRADSEKNLKRIWGYLDDKLDERLMEDGEERFRRVDRLPVAERVIWTSKNPDVDIEALVNSLRAEFMPAEAAAC